MHRHGLCFPREEDIAMPKAAPLPPRPNIAEKAMVETFATEFARQHESTPLTAVDRIVFPTDFSPCSLHALRYAEELARRFGAELIVLYVDFAPTMYELPDDGGPTGRRAVDGAIDVMRKHGLRARGICVHGFPVDQIVRTAATERADLIVMATHGRTGLKHALLGSVAEGVVRNAGCPVLIVRANADE
jgi:nucleotide-binding universal stress UspA family protein